MIAEVGARAKVKLGPKIKVLSFVKIENESTTNLPEGFHCASCFRKLVEWDNQYDGIREAVNDKLLQKKILVRLDDGKFARSINFKGNM